MKKYNFDDEKILILVSSLMVWNNTPPKMVEDRILKEGEEDLPDGEEPPPEDEPVLE